MKVILKVLGCGYAHANARNIFYISALQFVELHGDRSGYDDPAIVTGIGTIDGRRYMFMGHQKGRNTKENIQRNFGMPTPHGYVESWRPMLLYIIYNSTGVFK